MTEREHNCAESESREVKSERPLGLAQITTPASYGVDQCETGQVKALGAKSRPLQAHVSSPVKWAQQHLFGLNETHGAKNSLYQTVLQKGGQLRKGPSPLDLWSLPPQHGHQAPNHHQPQCHWALEIRRQTSQGPSA